MTARDPYGFGHTSGKGTDDTAFPPAGPRLFSRARWVDNIRQFIQVWVVECRGTERGFIAAGAECEESRTLQPLWREW